jgi:EXLDI family protein
MERLRPNKTIYVSLPRSPPRCGGMSSWRRASGRGSRRSSSGSAPVRAESLDELRPLVPADIYDLVAEAVDKPDIEDLDI